MPHEIHSPLCMSGFSGFLFARCEVSFHMCPRTITIRFDVEIFVVLFSRIALLCEAKRRNLTIVVRGQYFR
jgi:hypothetical protein